MDKLACLLADPADPFTRTLELELSTLFTVKRIKRGEPIPPSSLLLYDLDYAGPAEGGDGSIGYTRGEGDGKRLLHRPFPMEALRRLLSQGDTERALLPSHDFKSVTVSGEAVDLTDCEAALLRVLYEAEGKTVSRAHLASRVFPGASDPEGSVRVYIHYLRKKLERNGRRILLAHRGGGYSLLSH